MSSVNFVLNRFSGSYTLATAATLDAGTSVAIGDISAVAVYYISQSDIQNIFRFSSDSYDLNDLSNVDIKYFTYMSAWPTDLLINPSNAMLDRGDSNGALLQVGIPNRMLVKHDFLRYLALKLFNTAQGVDLFNNENALIANMNVLGQNSFQDISATLWNYSTGKTDSADGDKYIVDLSTNCLATTNNFITNDNICRELFQQILKNNAARFSTIVADANGTAPLPILSGDSISYKYTVSPAPSQETLTGVSAFGGRTYQIKLIVTNLSTAGLNTVVTDTQLV